MTPITKITTAFLIATTTTLCPAMETENTIKEGLQHLLDKSPDDGFLIASESPEGASAQFPIRFTRNTNFRENRWGNFVNTDGEYLQIFPTDSNGIPLTPDLDTTAPLVTASPKKLCHITKATTKVELHNINLAATSSTGTTVTVPFQVWGNYGDSHTINLIFTYVEHNPKTWQVTAIPPDHNSIVINTPYAAGFPLIFDNQGNIASICGLSMLSPTNNTPPMTFQTYAQSTSWSYTLTMDFGMIGENTGIKCTGTASDTSTAPFNDGHGKIKYLKSEIDKNTGQLIASFDNGTTQFYGKVPIATIGTPKINLF